MAGDQRFTKFGALRADLEAAWPDRLADAEALFAAGRFAWAIATGLYALEIRLKALICKRLDLPALPRVFESHDLESLLLLAGLSRRLASRRASKIRKNWVAVLEQAEELNDLRYHLGLGWGYQQADLSPITPGPSGWDSAMALETALTYGLKRQAQAFQEFAVTQGWGPEDYQVFVRLNLDWGRIHVILAARSFPNVDGEDPWFAVDRFLAERLRDEPILLESVGLSVRTFAQVRQGGLYTIPGSFADLNHLLATGPISHSAGPWFFPDRSYE